MAAPTYRSIQTKTSYGSSSMSLSRPTVSTGQWMIMIVNGGLGAGITLPSGWTELARFTSYGVTVVAKAQYGVDTSSSSWTVTGLGTVTRISGLVMSIAGTGDDTLIEAGAIGKTSTTSDSWTPPQLTLTEAEWMFVCGASMYYTSAPSTIGSFSIDTSGWTKRYEQSEAGGSRPNPTIHCSRSYDGYSANSNRPRLSGTDTVRGQAWTVAIGSPRPPGPSFNRDGVDGAEIGSLSGVDAANVAECDGVAA